MRKVLFILGQLSDMDVEWLGRSGSVEKIKAGTVLIEKGKHVDSVYILLDGIMSVYTPAASGNRQMASLKSGEIMGEMSFVDSSPPSASVKAEQDSMVLRIARPTLSAKLESDPVFASRFYKSIAMFISDRLRKTMASMNHESNNDDAASVLEEDELDSAVLDAVSLAGSRFDRMLKKLAGKSN